MNIRYSNEEHIFNQHMDGVPCLSFDMLDSMGIPNLYSSRFLSCDDTKEAGETGLRVVVMKNEELSEAAPVVLSNRQKLAEQLGSSIERECITDQKHTSNVYVVEEGDLGHFYPEEKPPKRRNVDGMVTDVPDALLTVFGADCPPVYLADPARKAIGLVHAGWRGTLEKIPEAAIDLMKERYGSKPSDIYAAIGPGICRECYEMGSEVYEAFEYKWGKSFAERILSKYPAKDDKGKIIPGGKYHLDLFEANRLTLLNAGIEKEHIAVSNVCTMCNADVFYSYRAHRMENEQCAMLVNRFQ